MAKKKAIAGSHLVRYGIAGDQKFLVGDLLNTYDELVINARMVAHMAGVLYTFDKSEGGGIVQYKVC